jgi:hypothetical protein
MCGLHLVQVPHQIIIEPIILVLSVDPIMLRCRPCISMPLGHNGGSVQHTSTRRFLSKRRMQKYTINNIKQNKLCKRKQSNTQTKTNEHEETNMKKRI